MSDLINAKQAAPLLKVSPEHIVNRLRKKKGFPKAYKPGREYLWFKQEILHWRNQTRV